MECGMYMYIYMYVYVYTWYDIWYGAVQISMKGYIFDLE